MLRVHEIFYVLIWLLGVLEPSPFPPNPICQHSHHRGENGLRLGVEKERDLPSPAIMNNHCLAPLSEKSWIQDEMMEGKYL